MTHLLLIRGGDLRHIGGGGSILLGGLNLRGGGRGQGASTAVAVISWPSICPIEKRVESQNPYLTSTYPGGQDRKESEGTRTTHSGHREKAAHDRSHWRSHQETHGGRTPTQDSISVRWIAFRGSPLRLAPKEQARACLARGGLCSHPELEAGAAPGRRPCKQREGGRREEQGDQSGFSRTEMG